MTGAELKERGKNRIFDQIVVVTNDIFAKMANMQRIQKDVPGKICNFSDADGKLTDSQGRPFAYSRRQASYYYANTEVCFIQPESGNDLYAEYLAKYGEGICCIRERVSEEDFAAREEHFASRGITPAQRLESDTARAFWLDLTDRLGILYEVICGDETEDGNICRIDRPITQINVSTPDLRKTIETLTDLFEIGPWEVGRQCNAISHDTAFALDGEFKDQEFSYLLAILVCGNMEWEVIEPEKGYLAYTDFVNSRGAGFHHMLQEIPQDKWEERLALYVKDGVALNNKGSLGPVSWVYMETVKDLGFYLELRTDAVMDKLPDGYLQYFYPED